MISEMLVTGIQGSFKDKNDPVVLDDMSGNVSVAGLEAFVSTGSESKTGNVVESGLLGVAYPEGDVVKGLVFAGGC
jgi:hypothetical protein